MTDLQIRRTLDRFIKEHGSQKQAAAALKLSESYLSEILSGRRQVPHSVLSAVGLERVTITRRAKASVSR
jgi:DNA-binding transcriptional regulator YdaS (Cro superfamily)